MKITTFNRYINFNTAIFRYVSLPETTPILGNHHMPDWWLLLSVFDQIVHGYHAKYPMLVALQSDMYPPVSPSFLIDAHSRMSNP